MNLSWTTATATLPRRSISPADISTMLMGVESASLTLRQEAKRRDRRLPQTQASVSDGHSRSGRASPDILRPFSHRCQFSAAAGIRKIPPALACAQLAKSGLCFLKVIPLVIVDGNVKTSPMEDFDRQSHIRPVFPHTRLLKTGVRGAYLTAHLVLDKGPSGDRHERSMDFHRFSADRQTR